MANIAITTADTIDVVESFIQMTLVAAEAIEAGYAVRIDTSTGKFTYANASDAAEGRVYGIATKSVAAGEPVTAVRKGVLDGFTLASIDYDKAITLSDTDGRLDDGDGSPSTTVTVGRVIPGAAVTLGTDNDKLLFVDL